MNDDLHDFEQFMKQREEASRAFMSGDISPLERIATHVSPATIFGPTGDYVEGADKVNAANASGAKRYCKWRLTTASPTGQAFSGQPLE
jgi:hypothetical protein